MIVVCAVHTAEASILTKCGVVLLPFSELFDFVARELIKNVPATSDSSLLAPQGSQHCFWDIFISPPRFPPARVVLIVVAWLNSRGSAFVNERNIVVDYLCGMITLFDKFNN